MDYDYRQLTSADVSMLKELLNVFGEVFGEPDTYQGKVPSDAYLKSLLGKEYFITLVAQERDRIVGGLAAYVLGNIGDGSI